MYARATSGDRLNNNKFSICSIGNISAVLKMKKDNCFLGRFSLMSKSVSFMQVLRVRVSVYVRAREILCSYFVSVCTESGHPICGNGLVEEGEECDCGYNDQCKEECCYSADSPESQKCKRKPGKVCR